MKRGTKSLEMKFSGVISSVATSLVYSPLSRGMSSNDALICEARVERMNENLLLI
jgi:hypothetical protein